MMWDLSLHTKVKTNYEPCCCGLPSPQHYVRPNASGNADYVRLNTSAKPRLRVCKHRIRTESWGVGELGGRRVGESGNWGKFGDWEVGELGIWGIGELGNCGIGELGCWGTIHAGGEPGLRPITCST